MATRRYPKFWVSAELGDLNTYKSDNVQPKNHPDETFELYSVPIFPEGKPELQIGSDIGSSKQAVEPDDVLVCKINPRINRVWRTGNKGSHRQIASSEWIIVRQPKLHPQYLLRYFQSHDFRNRLCADVTGVGGSLTRAQPKKVATFPIPIPPRAEQKVIADKLDTLLAQVENTKARLERIPQLLKRFKQSVLASAINGKLTVVWRDKRGIDISSWNMRRVDELSEKVVVGYVGSIKQHFSDTGIPLLSTTHIQEDGFTWKDRRFVTAEFSSKTKKSIVKPKDILVARHGDSGRCCLVPSDYPEYQTSNVVAIKTGSMALPEYIAMAMNAQKEIVKEHQVGGVLKVVNTKSVAAHQLPTPSIEEQIEIVRRVDQLFAYADTIEKQVNSALGRVEHLTQSILAKAFRGELTEQWRKENPDLISGDNSAATLLERIQDKRASAKPEKRKGRK